MEEVKEEELEMGFVFIIIIGMCCIVLLYVHEKVWILGIFPECTAAILAGLIVGIGLNFFYEGTMLIKIVTFEPSTFFKFLLPPIMFYSGFNCHI